MLLERLVSVMTVAERRLEPRETVRPGRSGAETDCEGVADPRHRLGCCLCDQVPQGSDRELLTRGPGSLRLGACPLRRERTSRAGLRRLGVSRRPPLVRRLQLPYELEIHGDVSESSAEEE